MTRQQEDSPDARPIHGGLPRCDTGPAARAGFVTRELAGLWCELRGHLRSAHAEYATRKAKP